MKMFLFISVLLGGVMASAAANADRDKRAEILLNAKNISQLKRELKEFDELDTLKQSCELEKRDGLVPRHCYLLLSLEKLTKAQFKQKTDELDEICDENVGSVKIIVPMGGLSRTCSAKARAQNKQIEYSQRN